jgi:TetR/AcrR family transcriptional regulator, repressor of fatR-cypB operon
MPAKKDKRKAILDAMLDLVVERGFHNAPMSVLARRSGASPGVIYHYFRSKDELIRALHQEVASAKHRIFMAGLSDGMPPREALLRIWLNAYHFYRKHHKEASFLNQYMNSPYCSPASGNSGAPNPTATQIRKWLRPRHKGGLLKDLPPEAIESLTIGLAASLARSPRAFSEATLSRIAETVWAAIADE